MTCGLGLGLLVIFLVQAERVCCLWTKAQRFQNRNTYVGFPPADVRLIKSGSYPQNQVRQGFISPHTVQSSSSNTGAAVSSGSGLGFSTRSLAQVSLPARSSVRLVENSSVLKANRQRPFSPRANAPNVVKQSSGISSAVAGGTSVSQHRKNLSDIGRRSWPVQQETRHSKYLTSSSQPVHGPREGYSFRPVSQSAAQEPSRAAVKIPSSYSKTGSSAVLFGPVAPGPHGRSVQMQTYARGPAKRVSSSRRSEVPKARSLAPQTQAWQIHASSLEGSRPRSRLRSSKTSHNLAVSKSSTEGAPAHGFAPATVHEIPEHFGGFAIRRLKEPAVQKQQIARPPQRLVPSYPHVSSIYPVSNWRKRKL